MPARVAPWIAALLLVCAAGLAWSAATTDSVTVDEPAHVTAGYASLVTGDYRLSPDHPPLARWPCRSEQTYRFIFVFRPDRGW